MSDLPRTVPNVPVKVTLVDVAAAAGVSRSTASRAVNGTTTRSVPARLRRVKEVADRLGYVPDASAQAIARGRTSMVGLLVSSLGDAAAEQLSIGVADAARDAGLAPLVMSAHDDEETLVGNVRAMHRLRARGVVLALPPNLGIGRSALVESLHAFASSGGSVCTVGAELPGFSAVMADESGGARSLATLVCGAGYQSVVVVGGPEGASLTAVRRDGVLEAFAAVGRPVPPEGTVTSPDTVDGGRAAVLETLRDRAVRPQIVVTVSEQLVLGALLAIRELGLSVPQDVAIACLGDTAPSSHGVSLTNASPPLVQMARNAAEIAMMTSFASAVPRRVICPVIPVLGESTPPVPHLRSSL